MCSVSPPPSRLRASYCSASRGRRRSRWGRIARCGGGTGHGPGRNADPARHMVGLTSDDVDADWKRLKDAGVEFIEKPTDYGDVRLATLKDPDGNFVQLLQFKR